MSPTFHSSPGFASSAVTSPPTALRTGNISSSHDARLIGGLGTVFGPILGAFLVVPVESYLRAELGGLWAGTHLIVLGLVLTLCALFLKRGVVGAVAPLLRRWRVPGMDR